MLEFQLSFKLHVEANFPYRILVEEFVDGELFRDLVVVVGGKFRPLP